MILNRYASILGFLGRKWDRRFAGDAQTEVKTDRVLGRNSAGFNPAVRTFACCA